MSSTYKNFQAVVDADYKGIAKRFAEEMRDSIAPNIEIVSVYLQWLETSKVRRRIADAVQAPEGIVTCHTHQDPTRLAKGNHGEAFIGVRYTDATPRARRPRRLHIDIEMSKRCAFAIAQAHPEDLEALFSAFAVGGLTAVHAQLGDDVEHAHFSNERIGAWMERKVALSKNEVDMPTYDPRNAVQDVPARGPSNHVQTVADLEGMRRWWRNKW